MLADGEGHTKEQLLTCIGDPLSATPHNLMNHIFQLRKRLPKSHMIVAVRVVAKPTLYYHVKRITHQNDE